MKAFCLEACLLLIISQESCEDGFRNGGGMMIYSRERFFSAPFESVIFHASDKKKKCCNYRLRASKQKRVGRIAQQLQH